MIECDKSDQYLFLGFIARDGIQKLQIKWKPTKLSPVRKATEKTLACTKTPRNGVRTVHRGGGEWGYKHTSTNSQSKNSREASGMGESNGTFGQPRTNSRWSPMGESRHEMPKLHLPLFGGRRSQNSNTTLPGSEDPGDYDQGFLTETEKIVRKKRNVTFGRSDAFSKKQGKTETLEQYQCSLTEVVVKGKFRCPNSDYGGLETEIIRLPLEFQRCQKSRFRKTS